MPAPTAQTKVTPGSQAPTSPQGDTVIHPPATGWAADSVALPPVQAGDPLIGTGLPLGNAKEYFATLIRTSYTTRDYVPPYELVDSEVKKMTRERCASPNNNFIVFSAKKEEASLIGKEAERLLGVLTKTWLGDDAKPIVFKPPLIIGARIADELESGGGTNIYLRTARPTAFDGTYMQGSFRSMIDKCLPHELTHVILGTSLKDTVPTWAGEGAAISVESEASRDHFHSNLIQYLKTGRGITFENMFALKDYGRDINALYAQAHSTADYLIHAGDAIEKYEAAHHIGNDHVTGRQRFVRYVAEGMRAEKEGKSVTEAWQTATQKFYGERNLHTLQEHWRDWVLTGKLPTQ